MENQTNVGIVGAGAFAFFVVKELVKLPGVRLVGVFDEMVENAHRLKALYPELNVYDTLEELCGDAEITLVYIATPPYLHYSQSKMALSAGKHVICEKPAATKLSEAKELKRVAEEKDLLFVVNLMQRYNPLYRSVDDLIRQELLGKFLHGYFENYASDEFLKEQHWFWDEEKSGGIFIEHGVHFFDMFAGWLGDGVVAAAQKLNRPGYPGIWDKAYATVLYEDGIVNFYHAFDQPKVMDRQEMRLQFERGEITLTEWVPTSLTATALCTKEQLNSLRVLFPDAEISKLEVHQEAVVCTGRFKEISFNYKIKLRSKVTLEKEKLYQYLVTEMFKDQLAWISNRAHVRRITSENAVQSLMVAESAENRAWRISCDN